MRCDLAVELGGQQVGVVTVGVGGARHVDGVAAHGDSRRVVQAVSLRQHNGVAAVGLDERDLVLDVERGRGRDVRSEPS